MNRDEAIKGLECCTKPEEITFCKNVECPYALTAQDDCINLLMLDALTLLKAQEPMKPVYNEKKYGDHLPHCNNCGKRLGSYSVCKHANYCSYCGRAVKWDDCGRMG